MKRASGSYIRCCAIVTDRPGLVLDCAKVLQDELVDLDNLIGETRDNRFVLALSGIAQKGNGKRVVKRLTRALGGEWVAMVDGETLKPSPSWSRILRRPFVGSEAADAVMLLGQPRDKDWIEVRSTLARAGRSVVPILAMPRTDVAGDASQRGWGLGIYKVPVGPKPPRFNEDLEQSFRGSARLIKLPPAATSPADLIRRRATVIYSALDVQGIFFELMEPIDTSRAIVHMVEAERYTAQHAYGRGFTSKFEVLVSGVQTQDELESLFRIRKQLAFDVEVYFGWDSDNEAKKAA